MEEIKGIGASSGVAMAPCVVLPRIPKFRDDLIIPKSLIKAELKRFEQATKRLNVYLDEFIGQCKNDKTSSQILLVHKSLLNDCQFQDDIKKLIESGSDSISAVLRVTNEKTAMLEALENRYFSERSADLREVAQKLMCILADYEIPDLSGLEEPIVLAAENIPLSLLINRNPAKIKGIVTAVGGKTSHTAIIAQNMGIAAVVGCGDTVNSLQNGEMIFVDGLKGSVVYKINAEQQKRLQRYINQLTNYKLHLNMYADKPTVTKDNKRVLLCANIIDMSAYHDLASMNADGVGLFRTEFLYTENNAIPSENQQYLIYKSAIEQMKEKDVIIRTLDVGGDKSIPSVTLKDEDNPFMGYRAIRICLNNTELFKTQLKAILRASVYGKAKIMFPMISSVDELKQAKAIVYQCITELNDSGVPCSDKIKIGTMIEIPSAAIMADSLINECDFFSIGSNDLTQYTMAVDRMNSKVDYLYSHFEPAVLKLINISINACKKAGKLCALCGEMAEDKMAIPILLGMGLDEFSVSPYSMLSVRKLISLIDSKKAQAAAEHVLQLQNRLAVEQYINKTFTDEYEQLSQF